MDNKHYEIRDILFHSPSVRMKSGVYGFAKPIQAKKTPKNPENYPVVVVAGGKTMRFPAGVVLCHANANMGLDPNQALK